MRLKLQENPREWQKFTAVMMTLFIIIGTLLWWRGVMSRAIWFAVIGGASSMSALSLIRPRPFRLFYRAGMTASFHVGKVMGFVTLTLFFLFILTPLGLFLRLLGKDLLRLKRDAKVTSYWQPAKAKSALERMF